MCIKRHTQSERNDPLNIYYFNFKVSIASICTVTLKHLSKTGFNCSEKLTSKLWKQKEERKKKYRIKRYLTRQRRWQYSYIHIDQAIMLFSSVQKTAMEAHGRKKADTSLQLLSLRAPTPAQPSEKHQVKTMIRPFALSLAGTGTRKSLRHLGSHGRTTAPTNIQSNINIKQLSAIQPNAFRASIIPFL